MSALIILPTPQSTISVSIGQLITDPLQSDVVSFSPSSIPATHPISQEAGYRQAIVHDGNGHFLPTASEQDHTSQDSVFYLSAAQSSHTSLSLPKATFDAFRKDTSAQNFLLRSTLQRRSLYYVTGMQTLKDISLKPGDANDSSVAEASERKIRLPSHVRPGHARMDSAVDLDTNNDKDTSTDESIFALELLKVRCKVGPASEPHDVDDIDYEWTYHALNDDDLQLSIGLGKAVQVSELGARTDVVDEEDLSEQSWDYGSDDDEEGLGGF